MYLLFRFLHEAPAFALFIAICQRSRPTSGNSSLRELDVLESVARESAAKKDDQRLTPPAKTLCEHAATVPNVSEKALERCDCASLPSSPLRLSTTPNPTESMQTETSPVIATDLDDACDRLVQLMKSSNGILCYTGAGVSTSANLPDYRGPNGVIVTARKGRNVKLNNPATCDPTQAHLCIREFCYNDIFQHVLSQNCDGLHLRSGIPQNKLSEIHGNMHIEVCLNCKYLQFFRPTDVNPSSSKSSHRTGRQCSNCRNVLYDTIVQRGEEGFLPFPNNWRGVFEKLDECDLVICAGTSFEILGCYKKLFPAGLKIVVINIAPTKKDKDAVLVIREECDKVFVKLAAAFNLDIRHYCRSCDPVLNFRTSRRAYFMSNYTFCQCHIRVPRISSTRAAAIEDSVPGFMMGGLPGWINGQPELLEDDEDELSECESVELKRKRKRGRPRKNSTARISTKTTVKKSVGRPRKKVAKVEHEEAKPPCTPSHAESRAVEGDLSTFDLGEIANCLNDLISSVCAD